VSILSRDDSDSLWTVGYTTDTGPAYFYLYDRSARSTTFLFVSRPDLETYELASMVPIEFDARDGMHLMWYLTTPVGSDGKDLPLIVLVHGVPGRVMPGGSVPGSSCWQTVVMPFSRSISGDHRDTESIPQRRRSRMGVRRCTRTCSTARRGPSAQGNHADPNRVAIMGGSYGGYATLAALAFTPDEFACGVDIVGPQ